MSNRIELWGTTLLVVKMPETVSWVVKTLNDIPKSVPLKVMVWNGHAVRIADATLEEQPLPVTPPGHEVYKVHVGGTRYRCSQDCTWPVIKKHQGQVSVPAKELKAGDAVLAHPRFGKDSLHNLVGYQDFVTTSLAGCKPAREGGSMVAISIKGGGSVLLGNGVFCG